MSPTAYCSERVATTSLTVSPTITSPRPTGGAYDLASLIRPRM